MYPDIKTLHIACAFISVAGFIGRSFLKLYKPDWLHLRRTGHWIRIVPHCVDAILLGSAIYLAITSRQYPLEHAWLTAKVIALMLYIGLGFVVMRFAANNRQRWLALGLAVFTYAYIVSVAISRHPFPWL